ncbi:uncharacterized protein G2W53_012479 [Senna tora]|uniref:Uncharacterized protein n=1 Tax=Senna tora TaxID=362788 RepID=A0A834U0P5_9FABA|nr:uncharacterized protein G2W53_012479 [Senna tora]
MIKVLGHLPHSRFCVPIAAQPIAAPVVAARFRVAPAQPDVTSPAPEHTVSGTIQFLLLISSSSSQQQIASPEQDCSLLNLLPQLLHGLFHQALFLVNTSDTILQMPGFSSSTPFWFPHISPSVSSVPLAEVRWS